MNLLFLDLETYSTVPIKHGVYKYCEGVEPLLVQTARNNDPVFVQEWNRSTIVLLQECIDWADRVIVHNADFDFVVLEHSLINVPMHKRYCTMAQAHGHGLPGGLDKLCEIFKISQDKAKLKSGKDLIRLFCVPNKQGHRNSKLHFPKQWKEFLDYAASDVLAMRELYHKMPHWNDEHDAPIWRLDQKINKRGFAIDRQFAEATVGLLTTEAKKLDAEMVDATQKDDGTDESWVTKGTQRDAILEHLLMEHGVSLPDLTSSTLERRINDERLPEGVREILRIRLERSKTSTAKYSTLLRCVSKDGRLRGTEKFRGASRTGRWAAHTFKPDNLKRPMKDWPEIEFITRCLKIEFPELLDCSINVAASEAMRGVVVAAPGCKLLVGDYSQIEARITAWLAGQEDVLEAFRAIDAGTGPDIYKMAYAAAFDVHPDTVTSFQRQIGKVMTLFLGYGGGVGAFITGAITYKIDLEQLAEHAVKAIPQDVLLEAEKFWHRCKAENKTLGLTKAVFIACDALKRVWRRKNDRIESLWGDVENAIKRVLLAHGPQQVGRLHFDKVGAWVRMRLPSGRYLCYPSMRLDEDGLSYMGIDPYTKQWARIRTRGGTVVENAAQGTTADVLGVGMTNAAAVGMPIVLHVHDELVVEVKKNRFTPGALEHVMCAEEGWMEGLPVAAKAHEMDRYHKAG